MTEKQKTVYDEFAKYETAQRPLDIAISLGYNESAYISYEIKVLLKMNYLIQDNKGSMTKYKAIKM